MSRGVNPKRTYNSTGRQAQARLTRRRIIDAAHREFLDRGYAATTMASVATTATVSVETIYKSFGTKAGLVKAVFDVAVVGDDEPVPMLDREHVKANQAEPDPRRKLQMYTEYFVDSAARAVPVQLLVRNAAHTDAAAAQVWAQMVDERHRGMSAFAAHLYSGGHLRPGVSQAEAADVLFTYNSAELWELLVIQRGWRPARYGTWLTSQLIAALL